MVLLLSACVSPQPSWTAPSSSSSSLPVGPASPTPSASGPAPSQPCDGFPADNVWRADVSHLPVHKSSAAFIGSMGPNTGLHADFGAGLWEGGPIGIPVTTITGN